MAKYVIVTSQQELDEVFKFIGYSGLRKTYDWFKNYKHPSKGSGIPCFEIKKDKDSFSWDQTTYFEKQGKTIISFQQFEEEYLGKPKTPQFEEGQTVRCIGDGKGGGNGWKKGQMFTINKIDRYNSGDVLWGETYNGGGVYSRAVELVETYTPIANSYVISVDSYEKEEKIKKKFDENEHLSKPYNQMLEIKVKKVNKLKTKLQLS